MIDEIDWKQNKNAVISRYRLRKRVMIVPPHAEYDEYSISGSQKEHQES